MKAISLQWSVPLTAGGFCMLLFPLWVFGTPEASDRSAGWQLGLYVLLYYPPAVVTLFFFGWLHRWGSRKAQRPGIDLLYLAAAHGCLAAAIIVMAVAIVRIFS